MSRVAEQPSPSGRTLETLLLLANAVTSTSMAAIAWFCQLVQYPMLRSTEPDRLPEAAREHGRRIAPLVGPLMALEATSAVGLLALRRPITRDDSLSIALLSGVWASTAGVQARQHAVLRQRHDPAVLRDLVRWNLPRTLAWTARSALALRMLAAQRRAQGGPNTALSP